MADPSPACRKMPAMPPLVVYHHALAAWLDAWIAVQAPALAGKPVLPRAVHYEAACRRRLDDAREALLWPLGSSGRAA